MRAAVYDEFGGPDVISVREVDDPPVGPDVVLVRNHATSVNPVDWKIREGYLAGVLPMHLPIVPGWDVAGVVAAVGPAVRSGLREGDEVWGYVRRDDVCHGAAAELVPAPERTLARKPPELSFEEAAAVPLAGLTAWQSVVEALEVGPGDRLLVHAAAGGVGQFACQVAAARGATVIGTARPQNHDHLRSLGVHELIDHTAGLISEQLSEPADAVLDLIGGEALEDAPRQVRGGTRIVSVIDPEAVIGMGGRYVFVRPDAGHLDELAALIGAGRLRVDVAATHPLEQLAEAHRASEQGSTRGKIAITI